MFLYRQHGVAFPQVPVPSCSNFLLSKKYATFRNCNSVIFMANARALHVACLMRFALDCLQIFHLCIILGNFCCFITAKLSDRFQGFYVSGSKKKTCTSCAVNFGLQIPRYKGPYQIPAKNCILRVLQ